MTTAQEFIELDAEVMWDKIRGGLLGQMIGNLAGLPHEMLYISEPGNVEEYTPALPEGAETDDDTDFEWMYICAMQDKGTLFIPHQEVANLWRTRINRGIWCSNQYARVLMDIGFEPPMTGDFVLNPWADFNISGQFVCESFGLIAPGMPQTASRIGLHYTRVTIDGEPAQSTQLFTTMIAMAFLTDDIDEILDAGEAALDPNCVHKQLMDDIRGWHRENPDNWRATRALLKAKYTKYDGAMRDKNGYELNSGSTIAAVLYGNGDFAETLRTAFNFGWDADNTAATAGTIVGTMKGYRWMLSQGWQIVDRYRNTSRDGMPMDETISSFADRLITISESVIEDQGGERVRNGFRTVYRIPVQKPANVYPMPSFDSAQAKLRDKYHDWIMSSMKPSADAQDRARAAYMAIALDLAEEAKRVQPQDWAAALEELNRVEQISQVLYHHSDVPLADPLRERASKAGLKKGDSELTEWIWSRTTATTEDYESWSTES